MPSYLSQPLSPHPSQYYLHSELSVVHPHWYRPLFQHPSPHGRHLGRRFQSIAIENYTRLELVARPLRHQP